nr:dehydrodolichyl diphosphate synthase complex subunit spac4d7.04c [Quercus suber]
MTSTHGTHIRNWILSLPPVEYLLRHLRETLIGSLRCGPVPQHIAFVMDGNRRYARSRKLETVEGHHLGFEALAKILEVCYKSGVKVVTIYAFSIENFKRSKYEVDGLMDMAKTKLVQMSEHGELFDRYGASVRILGDRSLMRDDVQQQVDRAVEMTKHNTNAVLNVCFPYTSREEITHSIRDTVAQYSEPAAQASGSKRGFSESHIQRNIRSTRQLSMVEEEECPSRSKSPSHQQPLMPTLDGAAFSTPSDLDADSTEFSEPTSDLETSSSLQPASSQTSHSTSPVLAPTTTKTSSSKAKPHASPSNFPDSESITAATLTHNMYTHPAPPLDLLVRTSGVFRLSDFMLWQCHEHTEIRFLDCLWPEFDLWKFLPVLIEWQWKQRREGSGAIREHVKST